MMTKRSYYLRFLFGSFLGAVGYFVSIALAYMILSIVLIYQLPLEARETTTIFLISSFFFMSLSPIFYAVIFTLLSKYLKYATRSLILTSIVFYLINIVVVFSTIIFSVILFSEPGKDSVTATPLTSSVAFLYVYLSYSLILLILHPISLSNNIASETELHHPNLT